MDKETLSNYGWIVICILVMVVMIALATPFGTFISNAVKSTTNGLFDVSDKAMEAVGIEIDNEAKLENTIPEGLDVQITHKPTGDLIDTTNLFSITGYDVASGHDWDESITNNTYHYAGEFLATINQNGVNETRTLNYDFTIMDYGKNSITYLSKDLIGFTLRDMKDYQVTVSHPSGNKTIINFSVETIAPNGTPIEVAVIQYGYINENDEVVGYSDWYGLWTLDSATKTFTLISADTVVNESLVIYVDCGNKMFFSIFPPQ